MPPPPPAAHTSSSECASRRRKSTTLGEHTQKSNWAQGRPAHGTETSPNRTHNNAQGDHEVRALQQPPSAAHAEQAHQQTSPPPPSLYEVPANSKWAGAGWSLRDETFFFC